MILVNIINSCTVSRIYHYIVSNRSKIEEELCFGLLGFVSHICDNNAKNQYNNVVKKIVRRFITTKTVIYII